MSISLFFIVWSISCNGGFVLGDLISVLFDLFCLGFDGFGFVWFEGVLGLWCCFFGIGVVFVLGDIDDVVFEIIMFLVLGICIFCVVFN